MGDYADRLIPELAKLPLGFLYPMGKKQTAPPENKYPKYYDWADYIAGDFHFIRKYLPPQLNGKVIITNTVTSKDIEDLKARGASYLITTTPEFTGRSFGTNVVEALILAILGKRWEEVTKEDYLTMIERLDMKPRIVALN